MRVASSTSVRHAASRSKSSSVLRAGARSLSRRPATATVATATANKRSATTKSTTNDDSASTSTTTTHNRNPLASSLAAAALAAAAALSPVVSSSSTMFFLAPALPAKARLEGVNKPELLPEGPVTPAIDVAGFLTTGELSRIRSTSESLEKDTGIKLRVLAQNYPDTPGLAIKDYWGVDDDTVVFVADPNTGNILNFNVGAGVDLRVPRSFWSRLAGKYGTKGYWSRVGESTAILNAVGAIDECLREEPGRLQCGKVGGPYVGE